MKVITFYRYAQIDPESMQHEIQSYCKDNSIMGRILLAEEGINGAACADDRTIDEFKHWIGQRFDGITFRELDCNGQVYHKLVIKVRDEIVHFGKKVDLDNRGTYVTPSELKEWLDNDDVVMVDARNDYEAEVGKFRDAEVLPIETFREFADHADELQKYAGKKKVLYCTGGIRCEKATAYLRQEGFKDVYHIKGGIIEYVKQFPDTHYEGDLFVFDDRMVADVSSEPISTCTYCSTDTSNMINCRNMDCDRLFVICDTCTDAHDGCCSDACRKAPRQRPRKRLTRKIGKVLHYFSDIGIAHVELEETLSRDAHIAFLGKTTDFEQQGIEELRDENEQPITRAQPGQKITMPVKDTVRVNDELRVIESIYY